MAIPVISASCSYLGFRRNEPFQFQLGATGVPTSWAITAVPNATISSAGLLACTGIAAAGPVVFTVSATNSDGTGTREFVIGIAPEAASSVTSGDTSVEFDFDMATREVTKLTVVAAPSATTPSAPAVAEPLAWWKKDDIFLVRVRCRKNGIVIDPTATSLKLALKELEPEGDIVLSTNFVQVGTGESAYIDLLVDLSSDAVKTALSNYEDDKGTFFDALAELQLERSVTHNGAAVTLRLTSRTFTVRLDRDMIP